MKPGFRARFKMFFFWKKKLALFGQFFDQISYQNHCRPLKADIAPKMCLMGAKVIFLCLMGARTDCAYFTSLFSWARRTSSIPKSWKNLGYNALWLLSKRVLWGRFWEPFGPYGGIPNESRRKIFILQKSRVRLLSSSKPKFLCGDLRYIHKLFVSHWVHPNSISTRLL